MTFYCESCKKIEELENEREAWQKGWDFLINNGKVFNYCPNCCSGPALIEKLEEK